MKLNSYYPEPISAWANIEGAIPETGTSGVSFARLNATVVRVTKNSHVYQNGMFITFDAQTGTEAYLNGTWPITGATANTFDFTITGTVPTTPLEVKNGHITKIVKSYNIAKVGRIGNGFYKFYFINQMDDVDYIATTNAIYNGQTYNGPSWNDPDSYAIIGSGLISQQLTTCLIKTTTDDRTTGYNVKNLYIAVIGGIN